MSHVFPLRLASFLALAAWFFASVTLHAEEKEFSATLSAEDQKSTGVTHLTPEQISTLNVLVKRELILAKQGNVVNFAGEFSQRRSAPERAKAGIDKLTPDERSRLDATVARALATQPREHISTLTPVTSSAAVQGIGPKPIVHGSVTFVAGTSGGGNNFYGGGFEVEQIDPVHGYSISIGYSELHGKGLWGGYGYRYGRPGYRYGHDYGFEYGPWW